MASTACFLHHHALATPTCRSSFSLHHQIPTTRSVQLVFSAQQKQAAEDDNGGSVVVSRRFALTVLVGAASFGSKASPADAAYGEAANVFGKPKTNTDFLPYNGDGFKLSIPSKMESKQRERIPRSSSEKRRQL